MAGELPPIYTIGHSTRSIAGFVELLKVGSVDMVVDIRKTPRSRTNPHFNLETLPEALSPWQIGCVRIEELGGRRAKSRTIAPEVNGFWINQSFHNYADYALSDDFRSGLSQLDRLSRDQRLAIMCSEAVWWRCHRRIVADYLLYRGRMVVHLMGRGRAAPATLTAAATPLGNSLLYPAPVVG